MLIPDQALDCSPVVDHLDLVAGMFDTRGFGDVLDHATSPNPALRDRMLADAVTAMVLQGLGGYQPGARPRAALLAAPADLPPQIAPRGSHAAQR